MMKRQTRTTRGGNPPIDPHFKGLSMKGIATALVLAFALSAPTSAFANDVSDAEMTRLTQKLVRHAEKNQYAGIESAYASLLALNVPLTAEIHKYGADTARQDGRVADQVERLLAAQAAEPSDALTAELDAIYTSCGNVALRGIKGETTTLTKRGGPPFEPHLAKALSVATEAMAANEAFTGWLPIGEYDFGFKLVVIRSTPTGEQHEIDLNDEVVFEDACTSSQEDLTNVLAGALSNYGEGRWEDLDENIRYADQIVSCTTEEIPVHVAGRYHKVVALWAHHNQNHELAKAAAVLSRKAQPKDGLSPAIVKPDDAFNDVWAKAKSFVPPTIDVPIPRKGFVRNDGLKRSYRFEAYPTLAQLFDDDGKVIRTEYLMPTESFFEYDALGPGETNDHDYVGLGGSPRVPLFVGAGVAAVVGGVLYGLSLSSREAFKNSDDIHEMDTLHNQANGLGTAGITVGVVAIGLGVGAMISAPI